MFQNFEKKHGRVKTCPHSIKATCLNIKTTSTLSDHILLVQSSASTAAENLPPDTGWGIAHMQLLFSKCQENVLNTKCWLKIVLL